MTAVSRPALFRRKNRKLLLRYLVAILVGVALRYVRPWPIGPVDLVRSIGAVLILASSALVVAAVREFRRAGTSENPSEPTTAIVQSGPYRYSRNPMYVALTILAAGIALVANNLWVGVMLVPALVVMHWGVIFREERYLAAKFGAEYSNYRRKVRRWF